jgi:thioesterase domain-containing protein/acyl carrier protein
MKAPTTNSTNHTTPESLENAVAPDLSQPNSQPSTTSFWRTAQSNLRQRYQFPPLQKADRNGTLPLSLNQERLWWLERIQSNASVHHLSHVIRLNGLLNLAALEQSLQAITQRHEILRTSFSLIDGKPSQTILPDIQWSLPFEDLRHLAAEQQETEVQRQLCAQAEQPFDLGQAPLWRLKLLRLADDSHILLRTTHHIIFDGWSQTVFMQELGAFYQAFVSGNPSPLVDLPFQYVDYAQSQRQWLESEAFSNQLSYWQHKLGGVTVPLELPSDRPSSTTLSYQGIHQSLLLSESLTKGLKLHSYQQGVSLYVTLLTAFNVLLHQYTQQQDLLVCSPVAGRQRNETKRLLGYFNNVVVIRSDLSGDPTFRDLLEQVGQTTAEAHEHQDIPFQKVAELPNLLRTPLARAMFVFYNASSPFSGFLPHTLESLNLTLESVFVIGDTANFDMTLLMEEKAGQLAAVLQCKADLFTVERVSELLGNFEACLERLIANPDLQLADLPLFTQHPSTGFSDLEAISDSKPTEEDSQTDDCDEIERQLIQIWENVLGIPSIGIHDNFFTLGGHSLLALHLFAQIEQVFGQSLPLAALLEAPTIAQMAKLLSQDNASIPWFPLVTIQSGGARLPLFCMHGGGFNILIYRELAIKLHPDQPVYGLQARGLDGETQLVPQSVEDMAADYIHQIQTIQPHGPYFLAGLSNGGIIALEIAQQLKLQGEDVALLAMFDTYGPDGIQLLPPLPRFLSSLLYAIHYSAPRLIRKLQVKHLTNLLHRSIWKFQNQEHRKSQVEIAEQSSTKWMTGNSTPATGQKDRLNNWMNQISQYVLEHSPWSFFSPSAQVQGIEGSISETLKELEAAYSKVHQTYQPQPYAGKITLFRAGENPPGFHLDSALGWRAIARDGVEVYKIPGHHTSLMDSPLLSIRLQNLLDKAIASLN